MTNVHSILRSLIIYAVCIPLAVFLGYLLSNPLDPSSFVTLAAMLVVLCAPLLIRFHYPLMLLSWNMLAVLFFLPGRPQVWFATIAISFAISFTQRILNKEVRAISVPQLSRPILAICLVVVATGAMTGGFGMRALGGESYGGKRYFFIFLAILGYFALTSYRIPRERAGLYIGLFFLGGITAAIGDLYPGLGGAFPYIFFVFPPSDMAGGFALGITRFGGMAMASAGIFGYMMAKYGIRGIFYSGKPWRLAAFVFFSGLALFGGYRSVLLNFFAVFVLQFFLEGLHRTKLMPAMVLAVAMVGLLTLPFTAKLPPTVQRALAFLPIPLDPVVQQSADGSSEWRLRMWKAVLPQVPEHLLLGKGLGMTSQDFSYAVQYGSLGAFEEQWEAALSGDYHNGPLSVVIPFGIWGLIAFVWFLAASLRALYRNYRYGDPTLRTVNTFLLAMFIVRMLMFWVVVGGFYLDLLYFLGLLGLGVSLNGGVACPMPAPVPAESSINRLPSVLSRQRPVFSRS